MLPHRGQHPLLATHSCTPTAARSLSAPRAPTTAREPPAAHAPLAAHAPAPSRALTTSATMVDLRTELNHHRDGKDSRITIKHQRERRRNIEGRNLEGEFDSLTPVREAPMVHATRPPSSPGLSGGCMALAPHLRMVIWPCKFRPHLPKKYDMIVNSAEFLQIYSTSILAIGGD
jgi:hypothetical protein